MYSKDELRAELNRRRSTPQASNNSDSGYSREELLSELQRRKKPIEQESEYESVNPIMSFFGGVEKAGGDFAHGLIQPALESGYLGENLKKRSQAAGASRKAKYEEYERQNPDSAVIGKILGDIGISLPFAATGVGGSLGAAAKAPGYLKYLSTILGSGAGGAASGAAQYVNPGESRAENAMTSGLVGAGLGAAGPAAFQLGKGVAKGINKLRPSNIIAENFGGNLPIEDIMRNARAAEGTKTGLGRILQSPGLNEAYENFTTNVPFSGGKNILSDVGSQINKRAKDVIKGSEKMTDESLHNYLLDAKSKQTKFKNENFKPVSELEKKEKFGLQLKDTKRLINQNIDAIKESPLYRNNNKVRSSLNKLFDVSKNSENVESNILGPTGTPIRSGDRSSSIVHTRMIADELHDTAQKMLSNPNSIDQQQGKLLNKISSTMRNETKQEINKFGSEALKSADEKAMKNYKENYVPFLDKAVHKLLKGDELSETLIRDIIKPGRQLDKSSNIKKIQKFLPEDSKNLLGKSYLSTAMDKEGNLDPRQLVSKINSLGPRQMNALFDPETKDRILDFEKLVRLNPDAVNSMFNPKTGNRNVHYGSLMLSLLVGQTGAIPGLAAAGLQTAGAKIFNKLMTSEKLRNKVIKRKGELSILKGKLIKEEGE